MDTPLFEVDFVHDEETVEQAVSVMERTVFTTKQIWSFVAFWGLFVIPLVVVGATQQINYLFYIAAVFGLLPVLLRNSFRKEYIQAKSLRYGEKYWAPERKMTVYPARINIHAAYENPDYFMTKRDHDPEYLRLKDEMDAEMADRDFAVEKSRLYENDQIVIVYINRDRNQPVLKKYLTDSQLAKLRELPFKKHIIV